MLAEQSTKIVIDEKEYDLPEGIEQLSEDGLYAVDWNLIEIAKEASPSGDNFKFFNPRHLGQYEVDKNNKIELFLGQGFGKEDMKELMKDITNKGLDYPFLGYWVLEDNKVKIRAYDGERRWRCLDRLIEKNEKVWSAKDKQFLPAKEVYSKVVCRVKSMSEEEAFQRACAVSDTSVKWGDGCQARLVKKLYDAGKKDDYICKILNKSVQWLAETSSLNDLDDYCFQFLLENKINRKVALDLVKVKDVKTRRTWLDNAWKDAQETHEKIKNKNDRLLEKATIEEEVAESELDEAATSGADPETLAEKQEAVEVAVEKTKKRKTAAAASARPMVKGKNLNRASGGLLSGSLRGPKVKKLLEAVEELVEKNDTSLADIKTLQTLKVAYQCILDGEEDIENVLKKIV
jgi:hypothetical protein